MFGGMKAIVCFGLIICFGFPTFSQDDDSIEYDGLYCVNLLYKYNLKAGTYFCNSNVGKTRKVVAKSFNDTIVHQAIDSTGTVRFLDTLFVKNQILKQQYFTNKIKTVEIFTSRNTLEDKVELRFDSTGRVVKYSQFSFTDMDSTFHKYIRSNYGEFYHELIYQRLSTDSVISESKVNEVSVYDTTIVILGSDEVVFELYPNGKIKVKSNYIDNDKQKGIREYFNEVGEVIDTEYFNAEGYLKSH